MPQGHGGRRAGAGAPRNNINNLKMGRYSLQLALALFAADPREWELFLKRQKDDKHRARITLAAAILWVRLGLYRNSARPANNKRPY